MAALCDIMRHSITQTISTKERYYASFTAM